MGLSVIIPIVNEAPALNELLPYLNEQEVGPDEIIVVDADSTDESKGVAQKFGARYVNTGKGRARQLHYGAQMAEHEHLCFLHADTFPNENFVSQIQAALKDEKLVLAGFRSIMKGQKTRRLISFLNYTKTYFCPLIYRPYRFAFKGLRLLFGDQVMFCRKADYFTSGGFNPETKIMEEAELCLRMNQLGRIKQLSHKVYSSDRRVAELGLAKALRIYVYIALGWALGVSTDKLSARYKDIR